MKLPFTQVDAFADAPFTGNPAAVMPLDAWLPDAVLQSIAAENNLSETAFIIPAGGDADYELRWFTPGTEVALCGHATLAAGHVLLSRDPALDRVRLATRKAGILEVARAATGYALTLPAYAPAAKPLPGTLAALGIAQADTYWHPGRYALVAVASAAQVRAVVPDFRALAAENDMLTIVTAPGEDSDIVSRVFAPAAGIDEDPVTGSAHSVLAPWWAERLGRDSFTAYQASARGGGLDCTLSGDSVIMAGRCVTVIEGQFIL